jgi:hypothetical protein
MRLWKILIALLALSLMAEDASAGPIRRLRERRSGASSCGPAPVASSGACAGVAAAATPCVPGPVPGSTLVLVPVGTTVFTDADGNLWSMVKRAPVLPLSTVPNK